MWFVGVAGSLSSSTIEGNVIVGVGGASLSIVLFLLWTIFFCKAAASAAPPPFVRGSLTGEVGRDDDPMLFDPNIPEIEGKLYKNSSGKQIK